MSTSVKYLTKRLRDIGRLDLLAGVERGEFSTHAAAEWAGLINKQPATGSGSQNVARRNAWALHRRTRSGPEPATYNGHVVPMPDLAAALAEVEEMQRPSQPTVDREPEPIPSEPEHVAFPVGVIPCTSCQHPQAAAALREVLNVYMAACRGEPHRTGSTMPRACCQWLVQRPDARALIA